MTPLYKSKLSWMINADLVIEVIETQGFYEPAPWPAESPVTDASSDTSELVEHCEPHKALPAQPGHDDE